MQTAISHAPFFKPEALFLLPPTHPSPSRGKDKGEGEVISISASALVASGLNVPKVPSHFKKIRVGNW
jgi:hypothetical protein